MFIDHLRRPAISSLARKNIAKKINEKCKKVLLCPKCGGINGRLSPINNVMGGATYKFGISYGIAFLFINNK